MNNPFFYEPSDECRRAAKELADWLNGQPSRFCDHQASPEFRADADRGKMFGVLCYDAPGAESGSYIAAYSGQVCGRGDWPEFVPAVFDYLQPDGYFKQHEAEITQINHQIASLPSADDNQGDAAPATPKPSTHKGKKDGETDEEYVRRRQFENARLHQWKLSERTRLEEAEAARRRREDMTKSLKTLRRQKSDSLQRWLFGHFRMANAQGETRDLLQIAAAHYGSPTALPPAGSGECCEPKLLQYAFTHSLQPTSMAMFWWGESPASEVRHHLSFYPACNNKCKPILAWMLRGLDVDANPLEDTMRDMELLAKLRTLYEDGDICVVSKPSGLLSVPGKTGRESVLSEMRRRYPDSVSPLIVHRLDMDTSGIMVIAKTMDAYHGLQRQFAGHAIRKRYVALLEREVRPSEGTIALPLRPDLDDRPRQVADFAHGRKAITLYNMVDAQRVWLYPQTGRTHQLRVHCAHRQGLASPIVGDPLYGTAKAPRLMLHAEEMTFTHPTTGRRMTFTDRAPF